MVLYEYYCKTCNDVVEISHPMNHTPEIICSKCYKARTKKLGVGGLNFKGTGWGKDR